MIYAIPITGFVVGLIAGLYALKRQYGRIVLFLAAALVVLIVWLVLQAQEAQGYDGLGYLIGAVLMAAPVLFGLLAGSLLGLLRRRRANRSQTR